VTFVCADLEDALRSNEPERITAARAHAEGCPACGEELRLWDEIAAAAPSLRREWVSPALWARTKAALAAQEKTALARRRPALVALAADWRALAAGIAVVALALSGAWLFLRGLESPRSAEDLHEGQRRLLTERALGDIERSEGEYVRSIDNLSKLVAPTLEAPRSPLLLSYREKLMLIDAAIGECRAQVEKNRFNAHLRRELLSIYQEKQRTLEQVLEEEKNAL